MITKNQLRVKRFFDFVLALVLLPFIICPVIFLILLASIDTRKSGLFIQKRVGQHGRLFKILKVRSLTNSTHKLGAYGEYSSSFGKFLRNSKLDELPQLWNVIKGDMSFVGPRPDIQGFSDELEGEDRIILLVKPGITSEATLKYKDEDQILKHHPNPEFYNKTVIWKDKVKINKNYVENYSFYLDLKIIIKSLFIK